MNINRYEDIVDYLQQALQSSADDEGTYKQKAEEVQETILKLNAQVINRFRYTYPVQGKVSLFNEC